MAPRRMSAALAFVLLAVAMQTPAQGEAGPGRASAGSGAVERIIDLPLVGGARQRALFLPAADTRGVIVMLPGGTGEVGISRDGGLRHDKNFVVRSRDLWVKQGFSVLIPDTVDELNLRPLRSTPSYGALVASLVETAFRLTRRPVVLVGTSQGTIAATNAAGRLGSDGPLVALVLLETVSRPGRRSAETVFDAAPAKVRVPTLVVANARDECGVAPPEEADRVAAAFVDASKAAVIKVDGGRTGSPNPCSSSTPHGYAGMEATIVGDVSRWLAALPSLRP